MGASTMGSTKRMAVTGAVARQCTTVLRPALTSRYESSKLTAWGRYSTGHLEPNSYSLPGIAHGGEPTTSDLKSRLLNADVVRPYSPARHLEPEAYQLQQISEIPLLRCNGWKRERTVRLMAHAKALTKAKCDENVDTTLRKR